MSDPPTHPAVTYGSYLRIDDHRATRGLKPTRDIRLLIARYLSPVERGLQPARPGFSLRDPAVSLSFAAD